MATAVTAQPPEISLAQRLASNHKPIRTKALKTLRNYINLRSQKAEGFTSEDLLKIWKGLFYCLWMQDKPLLQEEISHRISGLINSFHTTDNQLLYFATFLQTVKREWNGIDRLRMDKYFQLVRFMFRQTFEVLKRREWESSVVRHFLQVFTEQLLQNTDQVPKGLMMHVLDLYMVELALVGSAELTADQNLTFIDPFCKTMAKTKDRFLVNCLSENIFRTIVDHVPYAIEDLMKELQQRGDDSDSGQASGEEEEDEMGEDELKNRSPKKTKFKNLNGTSDLVETSSRSKDQEDLDSMCSEENDGIGPVLQFDYGAIADRLFDLGSHINTQNINRVKMYSLVKTFRGLSEGIFPRIEGKRDMSGTKDDELFNKQKSKKKKKRKTLFQDKQKPNDSVQDCPLNDASEKPKKAKKSYGNIELPDTEADLDTSHVPLEACGTPRGQGKEMDRVALKNQSKLDRQLRTSEMEVDSETVFPHNESDSQSQVSKGRITIKKKRKSKKLKTNTQDVGQEVAEEFQTGLEECDGEHQANCCVVPVKEKSFKSRSGVESSQNKKDNKPEMSLPVESPMEDEQAECGISCMREKNKKKNKKKMNVGDARIDTESNGQIEETPSEEISLCSPVEVKKSRLEKIKSDDDEHGQSEDNTMVRKKRKSKKVGSFVRVVGQELENQSLLNKHSVGDEIRKQDGDNTAQVKLGTKTSKKKVKKNQRSTLEDAEVEIKFPAIFEDTDKHNSDEISRPPCPTSEEHLTTLCTQKGGTIKKKKGKNKNLVSSSQEVEKEVDSQDCFTEFVAKDRASTAVEVASGKIQATEALIIKPKKSKNTVAKEKDMKELQVHLDVIEPVVSSDTARITADENKSDTADWSQPKSVKKVKTKKLVSSNEEEFEAEEQFMGETASTKNTHAPWEKKKIQKKQERQPAEERKEEPSLKKTVKENAGTEILDTVPSNDMCVLEMKPLLKKGKKKRKLQMDEAEKRHSFGHAEDELGGKKVKVTGNELSSSVTPKKLKMDKASSKSDFVSFQGLIKPPTPLFCKTKPKSATPLATIKKFQTPKSETKKVTFGLKNNKTTEFRKMDSSLLVSPVGLSRVAFDPKKMPSSGVLKSRSPSPVRSVKNPAAKKRASAADFF